MPLYLHTQSTTFKSEINHIDANQSHISSNTSHTIYNSTIPSQNSKFNSSTNTKINPNSDFNKSHNFTRIKTQLTIKFPIKLFFSEKTKAKEETHCQDS